MRKDKRKLTALAVKRKARFERLKAKKEAKKIQQPSHVIFDAPNLAEVERWHLEHPRGNDGSNTGPDY